MPTQDIPSQGHKAAELAGGDRRIFFDMSSMRQYIRSHDRYSGIQRVVAMLLHETAGLIDRDRVYLCHVSHVDGTIRCLSLDQIDRAILLDPVALRGVFFSSFLNPAHLRQIRTAGLHGARAVIAAFRSTPVRAMPGRLADWLKAPRPQDAPARRAAPRARPVPFDSVARAGDILALFDCSWFPIQTRAFTRAKAQGLQVYTMVHDLIPLRMGEVTSDDEPRVFFDWLTASRDYTDSYLTVSQATARDLAAFLHDGGVQIPILPLPLVQATLPLPGADRQARADPKARAIEISRKSSRVRGALVVPYVLCVGTIEARKNIWRLLLAWKALIDRGHTDLPRLILAGRRGWGCEPAFDLLQATGNLYGHVSVIDSPGDEDLEFLYRHCLFAAMPSMMEGWGLPLGEALSYGKTAVVAQSSSLPEVGGDMVEYCDPLSVDSIASAVLALATNPARRAELEARIQAARLRNWGDVAQDLMQILGVSARGLG